MDTTKTQFSTPLFDIGETASLCRKAAHVEAKPKQATRRERAVCLLRTRGTVGATRYEIADHLGCPVQSVCSIALDLLRAEEAFETGDKRPSPYGRPSSVIVLREALR